MFTLIDKGFKYEAVNDAFCKAHNLVRDEISKNHVRHDAFEVLDRTPKLENQAA